MKINTKELKEITKKIAVVLAADSKASYVNIKTSSDNTVLYFSLTNGEFYVSFKLNLSEPEQFNTTVASKAFVDLINSLSGDSITLLTDESVLKIHAGKGKYKLPVIYENGVIKEPLQISVSEPTVDIDFPLEYLKSIDAINSQEFVRINEAKIKNPANKLYHISDAGCFTAANSFGACLNSFKLDTQLDVLVNKSIVKLFNLFDSTPRFYYELATNGNIKQAIITLISDNIRLGAYTTADPKTRAVLQAMVTKIRQMAAAIYQVNLVVNAKELSAALGRLAVAAKHTGKASMEGYEIELFAAGNSLFISDNNENSEEITLDASTQLVGTYKARTVISTLKSTIDLCKEDLVTIRATQGSHYVVDFGNVKYFIVTLVG